MKPLTITRMVIIILAVVSLLLFTLFIITSTPSTGRTDNTPSFALDEIAGYGSDNGGYQSNYGNVETVSGSDGIYTITDDSTVEMDSIPNDAPPPSGSDIGD